MESKNILRLKKGYQYPNQDLLELEISNFLNKSSLGKCYTIDAKQIEQFERKGGYSIVEGDGVYQLDSDYEIIVRKVSNKRMEGESIQRIKKILSEFN